MRMPRPPAKQGSTAIVPKYLFSVFEPTGSGPLGHYSSREEMEQSFIDTGAFNDELQRGGHLLFAEGLAAPSRSTVVDGRGESTVITDGPYLETNEYLGGFWIIQAADRDEALALAAGASKACRGAVEVRPFHTSEDIAALGNS